MSVVYVKIQDVSPIIMTIFSISNAICMILAKFLNRFYLDLKLMERIIKIQIEDKNPQKENRGKKNKLNNRSIIDIIKTKENSFDHENVINISSNTRLIKPEELVLSKEKIEKLRLKKKKICLLVKKE